MDQCPAAVELHGKQRRVFVFGRLHDAVALEVDEVYKPQDDESFMNERQRVYFRTKLLAWKEDILRESRETIVHLQDENHVLPDLADRASSETDRSLELRTRDRQRKLISKIESALKRLDDGCRNLWRLLRILIRNGISAIYRLTVKIWQRLQK